MKKLLMLALTVAITYQTFANKIDTAIFTSDFEKQLFLYRLSDSMVPAIQWFVAFQYSKECSSFIDQYNHFVTSLKNETQSYPVKKKLKTIFKNVHEKFFKKYEINSFFNDIFLSGNYNCVTASALYALILSDLKIAYTIRETPSHVYLIADPNHSNFLIETTLAKEGLVQYDNKSIANYIEYLHNNKIISDDEFIRESAETLFKKYFITDKAITIEELAGLQYYNKAVWMNEKSDYPEALKNIEKADLLNHSDQVGYLKSNILLLNLNEESTKKNYNGKNLAKYLLSNSVDKNAKAIGKDYFNMITNEIVINHPDIPKYDQVFSDFKEYADSTSISDFSQVYYFYKGYYLYTQSDLLPALQHLQQAYQINPENIQTRQLVMEIITKRIAQMNGYHNSLKFADKMLTMFPFLQKDKNMKKYFIYLYSHSIAESYKSGKSEISDEYLEKLEALIKESPDMGGDEDQVVQVYNQAASYYYSHGNYAAALKSLERGLKFLPDSWILNERHKSIANHKPNANAQRINKNYSIPAGKPKDKTKYLEAQAYAKLHRDSINAGVAKYLSGKWKANLSKHAESENIVLAFLENNKIRMGINDNIQVVGTWKFNLESGVLSLYYGDFTDEITILVLDISEKTMRGMSFNANGFTRDEEMTMTRLSDNLSPSPPFP